MAKIDSNVGVAIVLTREELEKMLSELRQCNDPEAWVRLAVTHDSAMPGDDDIVAYVQSSDGAESLIF